MERTLFLVLATIVSTTLLANSGGARITPNRIELRSFNITAASAKSRSLAPSNCADLHRPECNPLLKRVKLPPTLTSSSITECESAANCITFQRYSLIIGNFGQNEHLSIFSEDWTCTDKTNQLGWDGSELAKPEEMYQFLEITPEMVDGDVCKVTRSETPLPTELNEYLMVDTGADVEGCKRMQRLMARYIFHNNKLRANTKASVLVTHSDSDHSFCAHSTSSLISKMLKGDGNGDMQDERTITTLFENNNWNALTQLFLDLGPLTAADKGKFNEVYSNRVDALLTKHGYEIPIIENVNKNKGCKDHLDKNLDTCMSTFVGVGVQKVLKNPNHQRSINTDGEFEIRYRQNFLKEESVAISRRLNVFSAGKNVDSTLTPSVEPTRPPLPAGYPFTGITSMWEAAQTKYIAVSPTVGQFYCCLLPGIGVAEPMFEKLIMDWIGDAGTYLFSTNSPKSFSNVDSIAINRASASTLVNLVGSPTMPGLLTGDAFCNDAISGARKALATPNGDGLELFFYKVSHHATTDEDYNDAGCYKKEKMSAEYYVISGGKKLDKNPDFGTLMTILTANNRGTKMEWNVMSKRCRLAVKPATPLTIIFSHPSLYIKKDQGTFKAGENHFDAFLNVDPNDPNGCDSCYSPWCRAYNIAVVCESDNPVPPHFLLRTEIVMKYQNGNFVKRSDRKRLALSNDGNNRLRHVATMAHDDKTMISGTGPFNGGQFCSP